MAASELLAGRGSAAGGRAALTLAVSDPRPIGVFDSGVGGLTVLREIIRRLPGESTIYLGDNARAPYGAGPTTRSSPSRPQSLDALVERDVKAIVVACNTSTAVALGRLRRRYDLPVLGVIRPGAAAAALATRNRRVGVIATPATIRSHAYFAAIKDENPAVEVYEHATPALVPLVEAGELSGPSPRRPSREALAPLLGERDARGEFIFPLPASARRSTRCCSAAPTTRCCGRSSQASPGERVAIVDSATATASALAELLEHQRARVDARDGAGANGVAPTHLQLTTGDPGAFARWPDGCSGAAFPAVESVDLGSAGAHDRVAASGRRGVTIVRGRRVSSSDRAGCRRHRPADTWSGGPRGLRRMADVERLAGRPPVPAARARRSTVAQSTRPSRARRSMCRPTTVAAAPSADPIRMPACHARSSRHVAVVAPGHRAALRARPTRPTGNPRRTADRPARRSAPGRRSSAACAWVRLRSPHPRRATSIEPVHAQQLDQCRRRRGRRVDDRDPLPGLSLRGSAAAAGSACSRAATCRSSRRAAAGRSTRRRRRARRAAARGPRATVASAIGPDSSPASTSGTSAGVACS